MSEMESQVDESTVSEDDEEGAGAEVGLTEAEKDALIVKLRRENASKRVKAKDLDEKLAKYSAWEKSQMSELERAKAEKAEVENTLKELLVEKRQGAAGKNAKLDPELWDRVRGDTDEEMLADAKRLAKKYPAESGSAPVPATANSMFAGRRGEPVGSDAPASANDQLRALFNS